LRKKLELPTQTNLFEFLMSIGKDDPISSPLHTN
jgi:hypothetical protein